MAYTGNVAATYLATSRPDAWLRKHDLSDVVTNDAMVALNQASRDKNSMIAGLAGTALSQGAAFDLAEAERKAIAEENRRTRRANTIARMAGSLPGITPPSMAQLTGLSPDQLSLLSQMTAPYYGIMGGNQTALQNTPGIALPTG
jgi:hypothetical protein